MGYRAPSAEDVYRYLFRLDHESRSLTDGFGFSIIFVNDDSPICRDFLRKYFIDLCYRTADRIRIIFFSDLPEADFESIAYQMNTSRRAYRNGMLEAVIDTTSQKSLDEPYIVLLERFLEALHFQNYSEVDWLLTRISEIIGPRYADALYHIIREHRRGNPSEMEQRARELVLEIKNRERRLGRDPFRRVYDEHWRDLTPTSLIPIDAPERTRDLSFDAQMYTALPGVGEAMRFAARLGIGRHVPCFVFFTDVGKLSVDVFSVERLSATETYEQLRTWIDSFYEKNHFTVEKWNQLERDIASFANSVNRPLTTLRSWISRGDSLWNELRSTAQLIVKLSSALPKPEIYISVICQIS